MRILIVAPMPPHPDGAGAIPILLHAQLVGLSERNEVTVVTSFGDEGGEADAIERLTDAGFDVLAADRRQPNTALKRWRRRLRLASKWLAGTPWRAAWFADPGIQAILDRLAVEKSFDVAVVEDSAMAGFDLPRGAATVLTEHEVLRPRKTAWDTRGAVSEWPSWAWQELDWRRRYRFQRAAWKHFDRVLAFSRRDAEAIAELVPEVAGRIRVSPFGLALPAVAGPEAQDPNTLLFTGNFTHQPNRDAARWLTAEILPALRRLQADAHLKLIGSAPPPSVLALAGPGIEVVADPPSVERYLDAAAVVIAPVRTGGGMRMKVLQALAAGKAVVTTSRGAEGFDRFDETPPLLVADDAEGFAAAVAGLLADPGQRAELGRSARTFAERHFGPDAWAGRLEAIYREACEGREGTASRA